MTETAKERSLSRLRTIEGHIRGVQRMIEEDTYCIQVLAQTRAIQRALDKLNREILENHLRTCVVTAMKGAKEDDRSRVIEELLDVFKTSVRL